MRAVIQRVSSAHVTFGEGDGAREAGRIEQGFLILLGVHTDDTAEDAHWLANKIAAIRVFKDAAGKLNLSLRDVGGSALLVSNFTLYADCRNGRRPSFTEAASGVKARSLYELFGAALADCEIPVQYGAFGTEMQVSLHNDGPVTIIIDTPSRPGKEGSHLDTKAEI